ncbi:hypothetical protein GW17_00019460 [Ensete ventricosum]|nr:hypothetical protein GW17_00019460 [Ensete ventricosum]
MPRLPDPVAVPGCLPIDWKDLPELVKDRTTEGYRSLLQHLKRYEKAEGILVNSFREMKPEAAVVLKEKKPGRPPVHLVGPLVQTGRPSSSPEESLCLKWLDEQPVASVLYISFGSLGVLSRDQMKEMALGLRRAAIGSFGWSENRQTTASSEAAKTTLRATCLKAEQRMNALMLAEGRKVALRAKEDDDGVVRREQIAAAVRELMEGEEGRVARAKVRQLQEAAAAKAMVKKQILAMPSTR